jgi:hypothetical protein
MRRLFRVALRRFATKGGAFERFLNVGRLSRAVYRRVGAMKHGVFQRNSALCDGFRRLFRVALRRFAT